MNRSPVAFTVKTAIAMAALYVSLSLLAETPAAEASGTDLEKLKRQLDEVQKQLAKLSEKS